jgi:NADH-quinone oxidoreductase subunit N
MNDLIPAIPQQLTHILNDINYFIPEIYLGALFIIVLIADLVIGKTSDRYCRAIALAGVVLVLFKDYEQYLLVTKNDVFSMFSGMLLLHNKTISFKIVIDICSLLLLVYFPWDDKLRAHKKGMADLYTITIGAIFGLHLMVMAVNMLSVYLAIEMVSIASYLMVAYRSENAFSTEAGLKYVLFGAASSAILLYGISLLYGFTGTLNMFTNEFATALASANMSSIYLAVALCLVGIGFKLSFVPVHFWVPDVYQGAATPVTAWLSTVPKIAAFALLINFIGAFVALNSAYFDWFFRAPLAIIGIITMIAGNFAAVSQSNVKRMLAYSSVGHTGFALMAIVAFSGQGVTSLIFYLAVYAMGNIAALVLATYFSNIENAENIEDYHGLGLKHPVASVCFVVIMISLTGLPVTAGFTGKLFVFSALYTVYQQTHDIWLLIMMITGAATTVVALFYYIKIPLNLFLKKRENTGEQAFSDKKMLVFSILASLLLVLLGIFPNWLYSIL